MKNKVSKKNVPLESSRSTDRLNLSKAVSAPDMPNLKPSTVTVNLRMPVSMVNALKTQANKQDVPYQSYMKMLIAQALKMKTA
jgi:predicted DNA binding CopG/RHH family protein